jgi:S-formylglutathione hydrolase FrmB
MRIWTTTACISIALWSQIALSEVRHETFAAPSLGRDVTLSVQLPPSYGQGQTTYPMVVALHGLFERDGFWERRGLAAALDALWAKQAVPEFVLVAPAGGNSFFVNAGPGQSYQDLVTNDVPAWAEKQFRIKPGRDQRGLWGVSMGGYAALRVAFARPEVFGRVATHSAMLLLRPPTAEEGARMGQMAAFETVFGSPIDAARWAENDPLVLAEKVDAKAAPDLYFDCGSEDRYGLMTGNTRLHERLEARGVRHEFGLHPGNHGYEYVFTVFERSIGFLTRTWASPASPSPSPSGKPSPATRKN